MSASARGARAVLAVIAMAVALGWMPPAPATAASPGILVSLDGVHWVPGPEAGPLPPLGPLVPGGSGQWVVHIRNESSTLAVLRVSATVQGSLEYRTALSLSAAVGAVHGPVRSSAASDCIELLSDVALAEGEETVVTIEATVDVGAGDDVQGQTATAVVYATLVEAPGLVAGPACPLSPSEPTEPTERPSTVARTGGDVSAAVPGVFGALASALLGGALVVARRGLARDASVRDRSDAPTGRGR